MTGSGTLEGRVAIVTGGARGIGAAISSMLVARGASVVVADNGTSIDGRDGDPSVARDFADGLGARAVAYVEDMARAEAAAAARAAREALEHQTDGQHPGVHCPDQQRRRTGRSDQPEQDQKTAVGRR